MLPATRRATVAAGAVLLALLLAPAAAAPQDGFLFRPPSATLTLRAGPALFNTSSDVFDQMRRDLTLERRDFRGPSVGLDVAIALGQRFDLVVGGGYAEASRRSEFRDWVDQDDRPIEQTTTIRTVPVTASIRYLLARRGQRIGTMAWIPGGTTPYVGAGGGFNWYKLEQDGDFVDFRDNRIFTNVLESSGAAPALHGMAGLDHWFTPRLGLNAELRYGWARAQPGGAFREFDAVDLSGVQATIGFSVRW
jgi:opacity protein-like surface antigen